MKRREFIAGLGAAGWPLLLVRAQQQAKPTIGWLDAWPGGPAPHPALGGAFGRVAQETILQGVTVEAFRRGLAEVGLSEGLDVTVEYHMADFERLPALAADLVRRRPAAIVAISAPAALAIKAATPDIPIIFEVGVDPVELGLVASLNRPGSSLTGVAIPLAEIAEKRLQLLHQAVPAAETIALLSSPGDTLYDQLETRHVQSAARTLGLRLLVFKIATDAEITEVFAMVVEQQVGATLVGAPAIINAMRDQILSHAARLGLPTMFFYGRDARAGGLLSYGPDFNESYRQIGAYTGRILKGEKPADLPVVQPTKYKLLINLKTAKAHGLTIPPNLLALADEVIE